MPRAGGIQAGVRRALGRGRVVGGGDRHHPRRTRQQAGVHSFFEDRLGQPVPAGLSVGDQMPSAANHRGDVGDQRGRGDRRAVATRVRTAGRDATPKRFQ